MSGPRAGPEPLVITSLQNERVKAIRALEMRKARRETGLFVAEGASVLIAAREQGWVPETLALEATAARTGIVVDYLAWAKREGCELLPVSRAVMEKLAQKDNPQVLMGVFRQRWGELPAATAVTRQSCWVALEEIRDPGNLGTIIRTAHATAVSGIVLVGASCDPFARETVRASMGSIFAVPLVRAETAAFQTWMQAWPGDRVGLDTTGKVDIRYVKPRAPALLVMGSEGPGLSPETTRLVSMLARIPMVPGIDSLNLAIATAIALYAVQGPRLTVTKD